MLVNIVCANLSPTTMSEIAATAANAKPPTTPPRKTQIPFYTTPFNKGSASISQHINNVTLVFPAHFPTILRAVHVANFRVAYSCDVLNPWIKKDLDGFATVEIEDYLEYILERCLQPGKAVEQSEGNSTPLVEAVYQKIKAGRKEHRAELGQIYYSLKN